MKKLKFLLSFVFAILLIGRGLTQTIVDGHVRLGIELKKLSQAEADIAASNGYIDLLVYAYVDEAFIPHGVTVDASSGKVTSWRLGIGSLSHSFVIINADGSYDKTGSIATFAAAQKQLPNGTTCSGTTYQDDVLQGSYGGTITTPYRWQSGGCPTWAFGVETTSLSSAGAPVGQAQAVYAFDTVINNKKWYAVKLYKIRYLYHQAKSFYTTFYCGSSIIDGEQIQTMIGSSNLSLFDMNGTIIQGPGVGNQDWSYYMQNLQNGNNSNVSDPAERYNFIIGGVEVESDPEFVVSAETACGGSDLSGTLTVADGKWAGKTWANYNLTKVSVSKGTNSKSLNIGSDITISLPASGTTAVPFTISPAGYTLSNGEYATELSLTLTDKESGTAIEVKCDLSITVLPKLYFAATNATVTGATGLAAEVLPRANKTITVDETMSIYGKWTCEPFDGGGNPYNGTAGNKMSCGFTGSAFLFSNAQLFYSATETGTYGAVTTAGNHFSPSKFVGNAPGYYFLKLEYQGCEVTTDTIQIKVVKPLIPVLSVSTNCGAGLDARATIDAESTPTQWEWALLEDFGDCSPDAAISSSCTDWGFIMSVPAKVKLSEFDVYDFEVAYNTTAEGKTSRFFLTNTTNPIVQAMGVSENSMPGLVYSETFSFIPKATDGGIVWGSSNKLGLKNMYLLVRCMVDGQWSEWGFATLVGSESTDPIDNSLLYMGISATSCISRDISVDGVSLCHEPDTAVEIGERVKLRLFLNGLWMDREGEQLNTDDVYFEAGLDIQTEKFIVMWQRRASNADSWETFLVQDKGTLKAHENMPADKTLLYLESEEITIMEAMYYRAVFGRKGCYISTSDEQEEGDQFQGDGGGDHDEILVGSPLTKVGTFEDQVRIGLKTSIITGTLQGAPDQKNNWSNNPGEICSTGTLDLRVQNHGSGLTFEWEYLDQNNDWKSISGQNTDAFTNVQEFLFAQDNPNPLTDACMYGGCKRSFRVKVLVDEEFDYTNTYEITVYKAKPLFIDHSISPSNTDARVKGLIDPGLCDGESILLIAKTDNSPLDRSNFNNMVFEPSSSDGYAVIEFQEIRSSTLPMPSFSVSSIQTIAYQENNYGAYISPASSSNTMHHAYRVATKSRGNSVECVAFGDSLVVKKNPRARIGSLNPIEEVCANSEVTLTVSGSQNISEYNWYLPQPDNGSNVDATVKVDTAHSGSLTARFPISKVSEGGLFGDMVNVEGWGVFGTLPASTQADTVWCYGGSVTDVLVTSVVCTTPAPGVSPNPICSGEEVTLTWSDAFDESKHTLYDSVSGGTWSELTINSDYEVTQKSPTTIIKIKKQYTAAGAALGVKFRIDDQISIGTASTLLVVNPNPEKPANVKASADPTPVCEHASTTISVTHDKVEGNTYIYNWTKEGDASYTNSNQSFTFSGNNLTTAQAGTYFVTISVQTPAGCSAESDRASTTLTVNPAATKPTITLVNGPDICAGESHTFTPTVSPEPAQPDGSTYTYTWTPQSPAPSGTQSDKDYTLNTAANDQGGTYSYTFKVKVTTSSGCADSTEQTVSILVSPRSSKPVFSADIPSTAVCPGVEVSFSASVSNATSYQWYKVNPDSSIIKQDTRSNTNTLKFTAATDDMGKYRLLVISGNPSSGCADSTWSNIADLTVYDAAEQPTVSFNPNSEEVCEGKEVNIEATVGTPTAESTKTTYHWTKDGQALSPNPDGATYTIPSATLADAGTYTLEVTNTTDHSCVASASASYTLKVIALPDLESASVSTTATNNKACTSLVLTASAQNAAGAAITSGLSYQWQKLNGSSWQDIDNATSVSYTVADLGENQEYRCLVTMGLSGSDCSKTVESSSITVTVLKQPTAPTVSIDPDSYTVCSGGEATFTATVTPEDAAVGNYSYEWSGGSIAAGSQTEKTLSLSNVTATATYTFTVTETNDICSVTASESVTLTVTKPTNLSAIAIDGAVTGKCINEGSINLNVSGVETGSPLQELKYQWYKDGEPIDGANSVSYTVLAELANNGSYTCKVTATASDANPCDAEKTTPAVDVSFTMCGNETLSPGDAAEQNGETALVCEKGDQDKTIQVSYEPTIEKDAVTKVTWMKYATKPDDNSGDGTAIKSAEAPNLEWKFTLNHSEVFSAEDIAPKQYYVRVKIERGNVVSYSDSYRFVKVKNAPVVTASMQPTDTLVCVGSDVYFTANGTAPSAPSLDGITGIATSSEALQYEWKTPGDTKFLGGNQRQKAVTEVAITDSVYQAKIISGYKYTVSGGKGASNTCYDTSTVVTGKLSVKDAPVISLFTDEEGKTSKTICVDDEYPTLKAEFEHAEDTSWRRLASSGDYVRINIYNANPFTAALLKEAVEKPIKGQEDAIVNVIQVVASNNACPEVVKQYTLTINPTPNLDSVGISAEDQYCNSAANTIRAQAYKMKSENRREENNEDVTYSWQVSDDGTSGWRELGNEQSYTFPAGSEASDKYYRCIATAGAKNSPCPISDTSEVKRIRIYASTQAGEISPVPEAICSDGTAAISLVITAGDVKEWKITGNGSSVSITEDVSGTYILDPKDPKIEDLLSTTSRKSTLTVTVTVQSGEACADVVRSRTIDIYEPHPGIEYTLPEEPLCELTGIEYTPPIEDFEEIYWVYAGVHKETSSEKVFFIPANALLPKWQDDTTYEIKAYVYNTVPVLKDACKSEEKTGEFKVGRQPIAPQVSGDVTICEGSGYTLSAVRPAKSALTWSVTKNGEEAECDTPSAEGQTETLSLEDAEPGVYVYTIKDTTVCGEKASTHTVTVLEKAVAGNISLSNEGLYCAVSDINFTASEYKPEGATIQWQTSTDTNQSATITNENTGETISGNSMRSKTSGTQYFVRYVVKGTSPCGDSASKWVPFKIFKAPEISEISVNPSQICEGDQVTIAFTATAGYEYKIYSNSTTALTGGNELASGTVPDNGNVSHQVTAVYGEGHYYVVISDPSSKAESTGSALNCATSTLALGEVDIDHKVKAGELTITSPEPGGKLIDAFVGQRAQLSITGSTPTSGIKEELLWQSAKKEATPDYEHPKSLGTSRQQSLTTANQDTTYYWVKVSSTKGICPADYSDTVRIAVTLNENPTLEIESPVCENSDIRLTIGNLGENGKDQLAWDKLVWQYRQAGEENWEDITNKVSQNDDTETFTYSEGLPAGEYEFQYQYQFGDGELKAIEYPATLTVDAMSEGGYLWATDTVVCVGGSRPVLHLGGSVGLVQHLYFGKDNTNINTSLQTGGDTSGLYRVPTSNTEQSGWYLATVKNGACDEVRSDSIFIRIVEKPVAGTLNDTIVCLGTTATITYTGGKGDLITWQQASKQEGPYSDIEPAPENNTYTTDPLTDKVWIQVTVNTHSVCGPVSVQKEVVKLYDTLKITTQPVNYTVTGEGQTATFTASAGTAEARYGDGGRLEAVSPKDYKWQKSIDGGGTWEDITTEGDYTVNNGTLTVNNAETHTAELYRCVITSEPCDREVTSSTAAITAKAGLVPGQTKSRTDCDCYYPTDSVIYFVDGASGEGALHYRWQINRAAAPEVEDISWENIENIAELVGKYTIDSNRIVFHRMWDLSNIGALWIRAWVGDENSPEQPTTGNFVSVCDKPKPTYFIENEEIDVCERENGEEVSVFKMLASSSIDGRYVSYAYALKTDPATFTAIDMPETGDSDKETTVDFDGGKQLTFTVSAADSNLTIPAESAIPFAADSMVIRMEIRSCYTPDPDINTDTTIYRLLRVDVPVTITERALDTLVCAGSDFTMETGYSLTNKTIAGNQVTAQWYQKLDEPSPSGTQTYPASQDGRAVLLIENAATEKSGTWYVDLSTSHCPAVSDTITVGVHKVPAFKGIIEPAEVCENNEAVLTATIDADAESDYSLQWQRKVNGEWEDITEADPYSGVDTKTLTVNPASKAEAGEYRLQLTGTIASCAAESWAESSITVKLKPQIALNPAGNVAVQEGKIHNGVSVVVKSVEDMLGYSSEYLTIAEITAYQWWALFPDDENGEYEQFDKLSGNMEVVEGNAVEQTIRLKGIEKYDSTLFYAKVITECSDTITSQSDTLRVTDKFDVDKVDVSDAVCANDEEEVFEVSVTTTLEMQQALCFWEISKNNGETWERIDEAGVEYETDFAPNKFTLRIKNLSYDMNGWQLRATVSDGESTVRSDDNGRVITISLLPAPQFVCADVLEKSEDAVMINGTPVLSEFNVKEDCLPQSDITPDPGYSYSYWVKAPEETDSSKMQDSKQYNFVPDGGAGLYYVFFAVENACGSATVMDSVWVVEDLHPQDVTAIATTTPGADPDDPENTVQGPSDEDLTVDICEDNTLYLTASYTGGPAQGVVWKKDGATLNISAPYSLRGDTLVISPVSRDMDGAVFTCLFDMPGSIADVLSQNITLTVNRKPDASMAWVKVTDITAQEEGEELETGQALPGHTVELSVEGYDQTPTQVCFYKAVINPEDSTVISVEKLGCNDAGLTYTLTENAELLVHDNTWYYARIYNDCGYDSTDISNLRIFDDLKVVWIADTLIERPSGEEWDYTTSYPNPKPGELVVLYLPGTKPGEQDQIEAHEWVCENGTFTIRDTTLQGFMNMQTGDAKEEGDPNYHRSRWYYRTSPTEEWRVLSILDFVDDDAEVLSWEVWEHKGDLTLLNITSDKDGWQFVAVGENELFADTTCVVTLHVIPALQKGDVTMEPEQISTCFEAEAKFELRSELDLSKLTIDWQIKPADGEWSEKIDSLTNSTVYDMGTVGVDYNGYQVRAIVYGPCGRDTIEGEISITDPVVPGVMLLGDTVCLGESLLLTAQDTGNAGWLAFAWYVNDELVPDQTEATFDMGAYEAGEYKVRVEMAADTLTHGCVVPTRVEAEASVRINVLPEVKAYAQDSVIKAGAATVVWAEGNGSSYRWSPADNVENASDSVTNTVLFETHGTYVFTVTATNEFGCEASDTVVVVVQSNFRLDSIVAETVTPPLTPNGEGRLPGFPDNGYGVDDEGAKIVRTAVFTENEAEVWVCPGDEVRLAIATSGGESPITYTWTIDGGNAAVYENGLQDFPYETKDSVVVMFFPDSSTKELYCHIVDDFGEELDIVVHVHYFVPDFIYIETRPKTTSTRYYEDQAVYFHARPQRYPEYYWIRLTGEEINPDITEVVTQDAVYPTSFKMNENGEYYNAIWVSVIDRNGCRLWDSTGVELMKLPNVMVIDDPNRPFDGVIFPEFEVEITNMWGLRIKGFTDRNGNGSSRGWDGRTPSGTKVTGGTYYYRVKIPTLDGFVYMTGAVTVINR